MSDEVVMGRRCVPRGRAYLAPSGHQPIVPLTGSSASAPYEARGSSMLLLLEQCLNGLQFGLLLFLMAAG